MAPSRSDTMVRLHGYSNRGGLYGIGVMPPYIAD